MTARVDGNDVFASMCVHNFEAYKIDMVAISNENANTTGLELIVTKQMRLFLIDIEVIYRG